MIVIYHSRDLDGYCSGAICKKKYPEAKLIGYDYGQPIPWYIIPQGEPIIMVDVSLSMYDMWRLMVWSADQFTWIDHHISAINLYKSCSEHDLNPINAILEDGIAACEGTWNYFFPDEEMPNTVKWLGEYDTWRDSDQEYWNNFILPFQYGMRLGITSAENFPQQMLESESDIASIMVNKVFIQGNTILRYQKEQNNITMKNSFVIDFKGYKALCCNGAGFNSLAFESIWDESLHDLMMPFKYDGKEWMFSMYTTKDIDLSVIAKEFGGGGHKKACGFKLIELPNFIFNPINNK